jgi:hypothetical protein
MAVGSVDLAAGRTALTTFEARIKAAKPTTTRGLDIRRIALAVVVLARWVESQGLRPRFAKFDNDEWSIQALDDLLPLGLATLALLQAIIEAGDGSGPKVDPETLDKARTLKERMLGVLEYNCADNAWVMAQCADIRSGQGYYDLISDLDRLGGLYRKQAADLSDDKKRYDPADAQKAEDLATAILEAITSADTPEQRVLKAELAQLVTLLKFSYDETGAIGRVILRTSEDRVRFPESFRALK